MNSLKNDRDVQKLKIRIARLEGELQGSTAWLTNRTWRRALLEKLLIMEGYNRENIAEILYGRLRPSLPTIDPNGTDN